MLIAAALFGSAPLGLAGAFVAVPLGLTAAQVLRRRRQEIERDVAFSAPSGWSADELRAWPSLGAEDPRTSWSAAPATAAPDAARPRPLLLDRWTFTQMVWAGIAGWLYNAVSRFAERLVGGSSFAGARRAMLRVTGRLLAYLNTQSMRRTVAISALATVSTTGLLATGAGAVAAPSAPVSSGSAGAASTAASGSVTYTVQPGDTLTAIAERFGTTVSALVAQNSIADPDLIYAGQVLVIAGGSAPVQLAATSAGTGTAAGTTTPATSQVATAEATATVPAQTGTVTNGTLLSAMPATVQATFACIVQHESSGNPEAYNAVSGTMGLLQFLESTWLANGGAMYAATPLTATTQQQMNIGVLTYEHDGWAPWSSDGCV